MKKKTYQKLLTRSIVVQNVLLSGVSGNLSGEISGYKMAEGSSFEDE